MALELPALPSKNVLRVFLACLIVLLGVGIAKYISSSGEEPLLGSRAISTPQKDAAFELVQNALMAEAEQSIKDLSDASSSVSSGTSTPLTATQTFSRIVLDQYVAAKHQKATLTDADIQALVRNIMKTPLPTRGPKVYSQADLKTFSATPAELHEYGNKIVAAFEANIAPDLGKELYILSDMLQSNNAREGARLTAISGYYLKMINATLALKTPDILSASVLDYVNSLSALRLTFDNMAKVLSDPILAVKGINQREGFAESAIRNLETVGAILRAHGVTYAPNEKGIALFAGN